MSGPRLRHEACKARPQGRVGSRFRVFYEANQSSRIVTILAVGHKVHNLLFVHGKEVKL
jgi:mRNA-degrading endonuclease RelE of RelBE toxin-antitoxin system